MTYLTKSLPARHDAPDPWVRRCVTAFTIGALALAVYSSTLQPAFMRWGATDAEVACVLPGDDVIPFPAHVSTRAITIHAPVSAVWPWIAQIGQERAGLYSYTWLENLFGCDMTNADTIVEAWQNPQPGDRISLGPEGYPYFTVEAVEPEHAFVLRAGSGGFAGASWAFVVEPVDAETTRLIVRMRTSGSWSRMEAFINNVLTPPLHFIMEHEMLHGIARRAEALATGEAS